MRTMNLPGVALSALLIIPAASHAAQTSYDDRHRISVTGESLVSVAPDRIVVTFGVDTRDPSLAPAKQQNDVIVKRALASIKAMNIPDRAIQTDRISIEQRFESDGYRQVLAGYTVRNMFVVTLDDPAKVESLISTALDAGANYILNVEFQTSELKKYREQARELATRAAKEKAEKMAAALGEKVGQAIQIDEDYGRFAMSYNSSWRSDGWGSSARGGSVMSQNAVGISAGEAIETVALGQVGIRAGVRAVFELIH